MVREGAKRGVKTKKEHGRIGKKKKEEEERATPTQRRTNSTIT